MANHQCTAIVAALLLLVAPLEAGSPQAAEAVKLYDEGRYAEARALLEQLDASGQATGPLLYRLYFAQRTTEATAASQETLQKALALLEKEASVSSALEVHFYLVNALQSLGRTEDTARVAGEVTRRAEKGELTVTSALDKFRLGKLYADVGRPVEASTWFGQAVTAFESDPSAHGAYYQWACRYLADRALAASDYAAAEKYLTLLLDQGQPSAKDLDQLAVLRVRVEMFAEAAEVWGRAARANPADSTRANYCANLARMAAGLGSLPSASPSGSPWSAMGKADLEQLLTEQSETVRQARAAAEQARTGGTLDEAKTRELTEQIGRAKPLFVAAALEYAMRGHGIREAAFFGGYAPLIFHEREWALLPR